MRLRSLASLFVLLGVSTLGCAPPSARPVSRVERPAAAARVTSSSLTKKITGVSTWQVYRGYGQTVALGFDAKGRPANGLKLVMSEASGAGGTMAFRTLKGGRALEIDANGKVVKNTLVDDDVKMLYGGARVIEAFEKKVGAASSIRPASLGFGSAGAVQPLTAGNQNVDCATKATKALVDCGPLAIKCAKQALDWGRVGVYLGGWVGGLAGGAAGVGACIAANTSKAKSCGTSLYKAVESCGQALTDYFKEEEEKAPPPTDTPPTETTQTETTPDGESVEVPDGASTEGRTVPMELPSSSGSTEGRPVPMELPSSSGSTEGRTVPMESPSSSGSTEGRPVPMESPSSSGSTEGRPVPTSDWSASDEEPIEEETVEDTSDDGGSADEDLNPNVDDPEVDDQTTNEVPEETSQEPEELEAPSMEETSESDMGIESLRFMTVSRSSKRAAARRLGGACRSRHVLQCGGRSTSAYCRCVPE